MNKSIIIILLVLSVISCTQPSKSLITESDFRGKTFSLKWETSKDTFVIEFLDSTYVDLEDMRDDFRNWRIREYDNLTFLVLDGKAIGLEKNNDNSYKCTYIGLSDNTFTMTERESKWNRNFIYGTWVQKEFDKKYDYSIDENIRKPPPPPPPPGISESKYQWPPFFQITEDSIKLSKYYSVYTSAFELNRTNEYILMELGYDYSDKKNWQWNIRSLSADIMIVDRKISDLRVMKTVSDTLIRKKR